MCIRVGVLGWVRARVGARQRGYAGAAVGRAAGAAEAAGACVLGRVCITGAKATWSRCPWPCWWQQLRQGGQGQGWGRGAGEGRLPGGGQGRGARGRAGGQELGAPGREVEERGQGRTRGQGQGEGQGQVRGKGPRARAGAGAGARGRGNRNVEAGAGQGHGRKQQGTKWHLAVGKFGKAKWGPGSLGRGPRENRLAFPEGTIGKGCGRGPAGTGVARVP